MNYAGGILVSRKFWSAFIGSIFAIISHKITNDSNLSLAILGAFTTAIIGNAVEDTLMAKNESKPSSRVARRAKK